VDLGPRGRRCLSSCHRCRRWRSGACMITHTNQSRTDGDWIGRGSTASAVDAGVGRRGVDGTGAAGGTAARATKVRPSTSLIIIPQNKTHANDFVLCRSSRCLAGCLVPSARPMPYSFRAPIQTHCHHAVCQLPRLQSPSTLATAKRPQQQRRPAESRR
jgi:hypothetical protein